jgi:hypothetical protein
MKSLVDRIIDYESGLMEEQEALEFFQDLVDSGLAWQLQGHYGRTASRLIEAGLVKPKNRKRRQWHAEEAECLEGFDTEKERP